MAAAALERPPAELSEATVLLAAMALKERLEEAKRGNGGGNGNGNGVAYSGDGGNAGVGLDWPPGVLDAPVHVIAARIADSAPLASADDGLDEVKRHR